MINKKKYDSVLGQLRNIANRYNSAQLQNQLQDLEDFISNFNINVLVVGRFSAGKSSLLNKFIGIDDLLLEDENPTTSLVTELYPTNDESHFVGVRDDDSEVDIDPEAKDTLKGFKKAKFFVNSENLKKYADFTFVDTPGYGSGIEAHNNVLKSYINNGAAYILVMNPESPLDSQDLQFLREISQYSKYISVIATRADQNPNIDTVMNHCKESLEMYGLDVPIFKGSKWAENAADIIPNAISCFDVQEIFDEILKKRLLVTAGIFLAEISIMEKSSGLNMHDLDSKICEFEAAKMYLHSYFESQKKSLADAMGEKAVEAILEEVHSAMVSQEYAVARALMYNSDVAAQAILIEAIRPAINNALKDITARQINDMMRNISFEGVLNRPAATEMTGLITNVAKNAQSFIEQGYLQKIGSSIDALKKAQKTGSTFKNIASLVAILTDFINPVLEAVIVFLPDIISLLKEALGPSEEEKVQDYIKAVIYPQIQCKLHEHLSLVVNEQSEKLIALLQKNVEEQLVSVESQLQDIRRQKDSRKKEFKDLLQSISNDRKLLADLEKGLEA